MLGYYEADTSDPKKFNEQYGYLKTAETKAVKDINLLAKQLANGLGLNIRIRKSIAKANIAPAGGKYFFPPAIGEWERVVFDSYSANGRQRRIGCG